MMKAIAHNALVLLIALVVIGLVLLALFGADVPAVLDELLLLLAGGVVGAQVPRRART